MYQLDNFAIFAAEKDNLTHLVRWANDGAFKSVNTRKHKLNVKTFEILLSQIPKTTQLLIITMNREIYGFIELYNIDQINRSCYMNIFLDNFSQNFVLHGFKVIGMICNYLYSIAGMNKVSAEIPLDDSMILNIFKQRGFKIEVNKRAHQKVMGSFRAVIELSLLKNEFDI